MRFISVQGHFGNLKGKKIDFDEGLNVLHVPNEGGKTTLCNFLRVMLFGLNTSKRDTKNALSEKTKYQSLDSQPMSGRLCISYQDRPIAIERTTGKGGFMQEFKAYYLDTGEVCSLLTAKDCGSVLTGVGEEGYASSALVDGTDLSLAAPELNERLLSLSSTGDSTAAYHSAVGLLDRWRLDLRSPGGRGRYPQAVERIRQIDQSIAQIDKFGRDIAAHSVRASQLEKDAQEKRQEYEKIYTEFASKVTSRQDRLVALEKQSVKKIEELQGLLPKDHNKVQEAVDTLYSYEGAVRLEKEKREALSKANIQFEAQLEDLSQKQQKQMERLAFALKPRIRWWALIMAAILGISAAASVFSPLDFGKYSPYVPYVLSGFTIVALIIAFAGSVKKPTEPLFDYEAEKQRIKNDRKAIDDDQQQAADVLNECYDRLMAISSALQPSVSDIAEATSAVKLSLERLRELKAEERLLDSTRAELTASASQRFEGTDDRRLVDRKRSEMQSAEGILQDVLREISLIKGQMMALGDKDALLREKSELSEEISRLEWQLDAIAIAKETLTSANAAITSRISPQISSLAKEFLAFLTDNKYETLMLKPGFEASCAQKDSSVQLDPLRLSTGARDQLYLALRLAVCKVLLPQEEPVPLVLDDPFLTFDDERTKRGFELLQKIAQERQVILLTCRKIN